ncbi:MAG: hypothetical protein ACXQTP_00105 [Candidatus Methanofastidiosia archaeon]
MAKRSFDFKEFWGDEKRKAPTIRFSKGFIVVIIILLGLMYYVRPIFHGIIISLYRSPLVLFVLIAIILLFIFNTVISIRIKKAQFTDTKAYNRLQLTKKIFSSIIIIFIVCLIPLFFYSGYYMDRALYENTDYIAMETMPETETIRFLPFSVAKRYSLDAFTDPQFTLGDGDLVKEGDRLYWNFPMVPEGTILYFTKKPQGIISIAADKSTKEIETNFVEMEIGENIGITDNISWQIYKKDMFCDIENIFYQNDLIIVSVVKYRFHWIGRYPYFAGVYTIDYDGNIDFFTPEEAAKQEWGKRIYPESLARKQVEVVNTRNGLLNMWFYHKEMIEIQDVYSGGNRQPYLLDTEDGLIWMTAVEPRGRSFGLYEIFFQDAVTGEIHVYRISESNLTGPRYSIDYVKKNFPNFDWYSFYVSEPRPIIKDGQLYWLVSVVPNDSAGITKICVVNAKTSEVASFDIDAQVKAFFTGDVPHEEENLIEILKEKIADVEKLLDELKSLVSQLEEEN